MYTSLYTFLNLNASESMYDFITIVSFTKYASHTFFSFYLNVEINVDVLASVYEKLT